MSTYKHVWVGVHVNCSRKCGEPGTPFNPAKDEANTVESIGRPRSQVGARWQRTLEVVSSSRGWTGQSEGFM